MKHHNPNPYLSRSPTVVEIRMWGDRRGHDRMVFGFTTTYAISAYHHWCVLWVRISIRARCTTLCDKACQWLATDRWFSPGPPPIKTDRHDITEILLNVALNTINQTNKQNTYGTCQHRDSNPKWTNCWLLSRTSKVCDFRGYYPKFLFWKWNQTCKFWDFQEITVIISLLYHLL